jgi:hypothetical protein
MIAIVVGIAIIAIFYQAGRTTQRRDWRREAVGRGKSRDRSRDRKERQSEETCET